MDLSLFGLVPMIFGGASGPADTPRELLDAIYQPLLKGEDENLEEHYTPHLRELVTTNLQANAIDQGGARIDPDAPAIVNFNPFLNGESIDIKGLSVSEPVIQGEDAVALVSFDTESGPTILSVSMKMAEGEWKVDDVAAVGSGEKWLYSWLLQYDPFGQQ